MKHRMVTILQHRAGPALRALLRAGYRARRLYHAVFRPVTLGVRAIVIDGKDRVLLVRHTYTPGWFMPGGGVGRDETVPAAVIRELHEEAGIRARSRPRLIGLYANFLQLKSDHVAVYEISDWEEAGPAPHLGVEIAETGFFPLDALPDGVTPGTRQRLEEYRSRRHGSEFW